MSSINKMQQRTYSRLFGTVSASGSQGNEESQKSPFAGPTTAQPNTPTTMINAPTSLTNLAQLSGISLVPIHERRTTLNLSSNNSQIISYNGHQQPKITVNPRSRQNQPATIQRSPAVTNNHIREQPTYNLSTIPSIQLLNRVKTDHRASKTSSVTPRIVDPKPKKSAITSHSHPQSRLDESSSYYRTSQNVAISGHQIIDRSETSSVFANQITIPCASDEQSFNNDIVQATASESSPNGGNDNISLLRLMAIFNNPALTITPIGPTSTNAQHHIDPNSRASISAVFPDKTRYQPQHRDVDSYTHPFNRSQNADQLERFETYRNQSTKAEEIRYSSARRKSVAIKGSDIRMIDHNDQHEEQSFLSNGSHTVTLSWSPNDMINNNLSSPGHKTNPSVSIDPAKILKEFATAAETNHSPHVGQKGQTEQGGIAIARKIDLRPLEKLARDKINSHRVFSKHDYQKPTKSSLMSTKRRLYVPRIEKTSTKKVKLAPFKEIEVETIEQDSYVSEYHRTLIKIDEIAESSGLSRSTAAQPPDISVDSSNRFMSAIDNIKKEYEEKIEATSQLEDDDEELSFKCEFSFQQPLINEILVLPLQLPLDEELTEEKREYLSLLGLVSVHERNNIIARQSEQRLNNFSSLDEFGDFSDVDGEVRRIVDTLIQTGGDDINLRTETDIKRNELPFIEGLNRNTSRIKMNFMNALGLEKRSKRTTLYKVVKPQEVMTVHSMELKANNDLSNKVKNINSNRVAETKCSLVNASSKLVSPIAKITQAGTANQVNGNGMSSINASGGSAEVLRRAIKLAQASCREALHKAPNKDEYMKSLGLMAS